MYGPNGRADVPTAVRSEVTGAGAASEVIAAAEHMARWLRIKALDNPVSALTGMARIEVVPAFPDDQCPPLSRAPMRADETGALRLAYRRDGDTWAAPSVFMRIRNRAERALYCAVLDLTDRYEIDQELFEGDWIGAGQAVWLDQSPLRLALPSDEEPHPGASIRDWLLLLVAELPFDTSPFTIARLGDRATTRRTPVPRAFSNVLERLGLRALHRGRREPVPTACDWTTSIVPIVTCVPEMVRSR
jgi:hypothetical protein